MVEWRGADDERLGTLHEFPTVLHARAMFSFDISPETLQNALLSALSSLRATSLSREITVADRDGYYEGKISFKIGIGDGDAFRRFKAGEVARVREQIARLGPLNALDLAFNLHYSIRDGLHHKVHGDDYIVRLAFQSRRVELLVHHLKGIRRVEPAELLGLLVQALNSELSQNRFSKVELASVSST